MILFLAMLTVISLLISAAAYSYSLGCQAGVRFERDRCLDICAGTLQEGKISPTTQRVYRSIEGGRVRLISEKEFWA